MNLNRYVIIISASLVVYYIAVLAIDADHARKMKKIRAKSDAEMAAIKRSGYIVRQKIRNGDYEGLGFEQTEIDFQFYKIAELEK